MSAGIGAIFWKIPVFFPVTRDFDPETDSRETASTTKTAAM
jgi:hypothetical protein